MFVRKILFFLIFSFFSLPCWSSDLIFIGQIYPPFVLEEQNEVKGLYPDIVKEVCRKSKLNCKFKIIPFKRAIIDIEMGYEDAMMGLIKRPEREQFAIFTLPLVRSEKSYFGVKSKAGEFKTLKDLESVTVGVVRESSSKKLAVLHKEIVPSLTISEQSDNPTILRMIAAGRFGNKGLILGNRDVILHLIKAEGHTAIEELLKTQQIEEYSIAFSKKKVPLNLVEKFNTHLNEIIRTKSIDKIFQKYGIEQLN
jgi:polar amino acid transport system substrate-binding protein